MKNNQKRKEKYIKKEKNTEHKQTGVFACFLCKSHRVVMYNSNCTVSRTKLLSMDTTLSYHCCE